MILIFRAFSYFSFVNPSVVPQLEKAETGIDILSMPDRALSIKSIVHSVATKEHALSRLGFIPMSVPHVELVEAFKFGLCDKIINSHVANSISHLIRGGLFTAGRTPTIA